MNKTNGLVLSAFASFIGLIGFASAYFYFDTSSIVQSVIQFYKDFFAPIFRTLFGSYYSDEFLFAKVLLFFLLLLVINFVLKKSEFFGNKSGLIFIISLIVSLIGIRYLPENDLIKGILLPYGALAVALTTFLPFLIYFFFVHNINGSTGRRIAWVVYGIVFGVLLISRWNDISPTSQWIYIIGIIAVFVALIIDKWIHKQFALHEIEKTKKYANLKAQVQLMDLYNKAMETGNFKAAALFSRKLHELGTEGF